MESRNFSADILSLCILIILAIFLPSCASSIFQTVEGERAYKEFVIVQPGELDDMSSYAAKYLDDPKKDWMISTFNGVEKVVPGQELIIPLKPFEWGGLKSNGYQLVPILAYQDFSEKKDNSSERVVAKADFEKQMRFLQDNGFRVITIDQFFDFLEFRGQIPDKSIVITIDDGWKSIYDIAYPILKKYNYPATLFLCSNLIGKNKAISWDQVREMSKNGIDIQCGTKSDYNLVAHGARLSLKSYLNELEKELTEPKDVILKQTGKDCRYFVYPQGETNDLIIAQLKKYGYKAAFTENGKANPFFSDNYRVGRYVVSSDYSLAEFKKNLDTFQVKELQ